MKTIYHIICILSFLFYFAGTSPVDALQEASGAGSTSQNSQQIAKKALESTVLLVMEDAKGQPLSLGSGFFVQRQKEIFVATNLHVIRGASRGYAKIVNKKKKYSIIGVAAVDTIHDLAILKISFIAGEKAIPLGDSDTVKVGVTVYAAGNPKGLEGTFSQGIISSIRKIGADKILQITAPISPGSSGGPVLNEKGQVIGVSVATYRSGQNLNFAIPSNYLERMMGQVDYAIRTGIVKPFPKEKPTGSKSSILADLGGKGTQGVTLGKVSFSSQPSYSNKNIHTWIRFRSELSRYFSFSLRNHTRQDVKNVYFYIIFYDKSGDPIDVEERYFYAKIPAGLAKRVDSPEMRWDVKSMVEARGKIEFRILDFEIIE